MLMFMKFLSILLFGMCMSLHAKVLSQEAKVTLDMKNVALTTVLEELGKQSKSFGRVITQVRIDFYF